MQKKYITISIDIELNKALEHMKVDTNQTKSKIIEDSLRKNVELEKYINKK